MKSIKSFTEFITEGKTSGFNRTYTMSSTWWALWKKENEKNFRIEQDAFTKTFEVFDKKDKESKQPLFIFDYGRNIVFTNAEPKMFELEKIKPAEKAKAEETDAETGKKETIPGAPAPTGKEEKAEGEVETDKQTEEE